MTENKISIRNKFARKICTKMEKLNNDIQLLIKVDTTLKNQTGGTLTVLLQQLQTVATQQQTQKDNYVKQADEISQLNQTLIELSRDLTTNIIQLKTAFDAITREVENLVQKGNTVVNPTPIDKSEITALRQQVTEMDKFLGSSAPGLSSSASSASPRQPNK